MWRWQRLHTASFDGQHLVIRRLDGGEVRLTWSKIQAIKDEICGVDVEAIEVYPPADLVVGKLPRPKGRSFASKGPL